MTRFEEPDVEWIGASTDPADEQWGDAVEHTPLATAGDGEYDAVLVGEPYDGGVVGRRGAREGPGALRRALATLTTHHAEAGAIGRVGDLGDLTALRAAPDTVRDTQRAVGEVADAVHALDALPVFLGGDNSLSYANARPLLDRGSLGAINLDAHLDVRAVREDASSGTPYRQLLEAGLDAYVCLGARHFGTSTRYHAFAEERGATVLTAERVGRAPDETLDAALDAVADVDRVYVSLDLDVLDAVHAPGVSAPTPGGLTTRELFGLLRRLGAAPRVAGFEVVECAPSLDRDDRTARAGARAVAHFLAGYAGGDRAC